MTRTPLLPPTACWDQITLDFPGRVMEVVLAATGGELVGLRFGSESDLAAWLGPAAPNRDPAHPAIAAAARQLRAYAAGRPDRFDVPVKLHGSEFQRSVWAALRRIPYGATTTYGSIAASIGRSGQARAVGAAVGANPVGIIVPCHRVVGANGALTGFAGGLDNKVTLLAREGVTAL